MLKINLRKKNLSLKNILPPNKNHLIMIRNHLIILVVFFNIYNLSAQDPKDYANSITIDELKDKLYTYSSDEFQGRETGKEGQKIAVEYLKNHYINNDIKSLISDTYFQNVPLKSIKDPLINISM